MAIKIQLSADPAAGPGHGLLEVRGLGPLSEPVRFSVRRNQGSEPFLGESGTWQKSEAWHTADDFDEGTESVVLRVGSRLVDAIVGQPPSVAYQMTIEVAAASPQVGILAIRGPLLGSGAAAEPSQPAPAAVIPEPVVEEPPPEPPVVEETPLEPEAPSAAPSRSPWPLIAAAAVLLLALTGAIAWYLCWIPGVQGPSCSTETVVVDEGAFDCTGLGGDACYEVAQRALAAGDLETARQLCQFASDLGSNDATLCVAHMYDPQTWSAKESPVSEANWETAAFWYERAAENGSVEGQLGAGRLMCQNASSSFERKRGRAYLEQAAEGGAEGVNEVLAACEESAS